MPILDVEIVVAGGVGWEDNLATQLADAAGKIFNSPTGQTWVRLHRVARADYAENGGGPPDNVRPVFVTVLKAEVPPPEKLKVEARALAEAVGRVCQRPTENVHILYLPGARDRIAFGGEFLAG